MQAIIEGEEGRFALTHMELHDRVLFDSEMDPQGRGIVGYGLVKMPTSFYLSTRTIDILGELAVRLDGLKDNISSPINKKLLSDEDATSL